jgi:hypothetical protein
MADQEEQQRIEQCARDEAAKWHADRALMRSSIMIPMTTETSAQSPCTHQYAGVARVSVAIHWRLKSVMQRVSSGWLIGATACDEVLLEQRAQGSGPRAQKSWAKARLLQQPWCSLAEQTPTEPTEWIPVQSAADR